MYKGTKINLVTMKNLRKRISPDISFFKNDKPMKKLKVNGLEYESRTSINWYEVKIILDATVVEKYLKNKKSVNTVTTRINNKLLSVDGKNSVPYLPQENKKINNVFSQRSNVMVKLEIPEDIRLDHLVPEKNFDLVDVPIKQEDHISVQDTVTFNNDPINIDKFAESKNDDFESQNNSNNDNNVSLAAEAAEAKFKNELPESNIWCEEVTIGSEFKHEEIISQSCDATESIQQKNNNIASEETSASTIRRSSRKRKVCYNYDDYDHGVVKRSRTNCCSKSKTPLKTSRRKTLDSPQPENDTTQLFHCDHCDYQVPDKRDIVKHLYNRHISLLSNVLSCTYCKKKFKTNRIKVHEKKCSPKFLFKCQFCSVSVTSKPEMREHLVKMHVDEFRGRTRRKVVDDVWRDSVRDVITALEGEGNTNKLTRFGIKFLRSRRYYRERRTDFIRFYCNNCKKSYEKSGGKVKKRCPDCNIQLLYQCQKCKITRRTNQSIWQHFRGKDSNCGISKNLSFVTGEKRSKNTSNEATSADPENQQIYTCEMCDYKGLTKSQLYKHILSEHTSTVDKTCIERNFMCFKCGNTFCYGMWRFKRHEELCGLYIRYPCKICPSAYLTTSHIRTHLSSAHSDKLDGIDMEHIVDEICTFRNAIKEYNLTKFIEKYPKTTVIEKSIDTTNCYLAGIQNFLKPVCLNCNATISHSSEHCFKCQKNLKFLCLRCDEYFDKYTTAWEHVSQTCKNGISEMPIKKSTEGPIKFKALLSKNARNLLHCDHCSFKNSSKSVLSGHMVKHKETASSITAPFTCLKCNSNFYTKEDVNYHKRKCRTNYIYSCQLDLCAYTAATYKKMKEHAIRCHSHYFDDGKGFSKSFYEVMQKIKNNRRVNNASNRRLIQIETGKIKRTFSENIGSVRFHCPNCLESFEKKIPHMKNIKHCSKCRNRLILECKFCNKVYACWGTITSHFGKNLCPGIRPSNALKVAAHELDHSYAGKDCLDHSYASKYGPPDTSDNEEF